MSQVFGSRPLALDLPAGLDDQGVLDRDVHRLTRADGREHEFGVGSD